MMTIALAPETEEKLKEIAAREGRDPNALAKVLLTALLEDIEQDHQEMLAALAEALEGDPANDLSFEDYQAQFETDRAARQQKREDAQKAAA